MTGGGRRLGAGRKKTHPLDRVTLCCGAEWEKTISFDEVLRADRLSRQIKKRGSGFVDHYEDLKKIHARLSRIPVSQRTQYAEDAHIAENDESQRANLINDASYLITKELGNKRLWSFSTLSNADINYVYEKIRLTVWDQFHIKLSHRQIRSRIQIYQKLLGRHDF